MTSELDEIFSEVFDAASSRRVLFCDSGFLEVLKWKQVPINSQKCLLLPLSVEGLGEYHRDCVAVYRPDQAVFLVSSPLKTLEATILSDATLCGPPLNMQFLSGPGSKSAISQRAL